MKKSFVVCSLTAAAVLFLCYCKKGEPVEKQPYMQFRLEGFYPDSALFYQVKVNDSTVSEFAGFSGGRTVNMVNGIKGQLPWYDSARLKITIVKKSHPNVIFDSVVYLTNDNDFLLLQMDPQKNPALVNKRIVTITEPRPGTDSLRVRFYFDENDDIRRNGNLLPSIDLQLYSYRIDSLGYSTEPPLKNEGRIKAMKRGELSPYFTIARTNKIRNYVIVIYPPNSSLSTAPQYDRQYDEIDGFIGGSLPVNDDNGIFQTFRVTKIQPYVQYRNASYLFGFK